MKQKSCYVCKEAKDIDQFHVDKRGKDGHQGKCKVCQAEYQRSYRKTEHGRAITNKHARIQYHERGGKEYNKTYKQREYVKASEREYAKKRYHSPEGKAYFRKYYKSESFRDTQRRYNKSPKGLAAAKRARQRYPMRTKARAKISQAVWKGDIPSAATLICEQCGNDAREYHHHKGYEMEFWLDVIPLCIKCHGH